MTESPEPTASPAPVPPRRRHDRAVKIGFAVAAVAIVLLVWWHQRRGGDWEGWTTDLAAAKARAKTEDRHVLVLFHATPPGQLTRDFLRRTLGKKANREALDKLVIARVHIALNTDLTSEVARSYRVRALPTLVLLGPDGAERNRREREAILPEIAFREGFLDGSKPVSPPGPSTRP